MPRWREILISRATNQRLPASRGPGSRAPRPFLLSLCTDVRGKLNSPKFAVTSEAPFVGFNPANIPTHLRPPYLRASWPRSWREIVTSGYDLLPKIRPRNFPQTDPQSAAENIYDSPARVPLPRRYGATSTPMRWECSPDLLCS